METPEDKKCCENKKCCCPCHKMPGIFIALIGIAMLLGTLETFSPKAEWISVSVLVILLGLQKTCSGMCKCCDKA